MSPPKLVNILVIDDDKAMRHMLRLVLEREEYRVSEAESADQALQMASKEIFDAILCDIRMPGTDGLSFLALPSIRACSAVIIMMSAYGSIDTAIECMKRGAYDYISKPFKADEVLLTLKKAEERQRLEQENRQLKKELTQRQGAITAADIVHVSHSISQLLQQVEKIAASETNVLITGETGTGKELIAQALHQYSPRASGPFLAVNCSAIAAGLLESELFGHVRGAFTGADRNHQGLFAAASGGTLFLDEIADFPLHLQPKLLRVLQESEIRAVGSTRSETINTRVVAACGTDLKQMIDEGRFRQDLYYRLAVIDLHIPPLRERPEDIEALSHHFLAEITRRERLPLPQLCKDDLALLQGYHWPGNVRELKNFIEKAVIFSRPGEINLHQLPSERRSTMRNDRADLSLKNTIKRIEKEYILRALQQTSGNRTQAASLLEISLRSLMYKITEYDIK
ncbi:MAG: sigma-54 dependent transcriptional regulator [Desulfuromonadales bacterium]|nr:sigma-54 dependent transcriptional regulator [Desulfuromonadales bacterium]